jgi:hypothetical protein
MKNSGCDCGIRSAEFDCEIKGGRSPVADWSCSCAIVVAVEADIRCGYGQKINSMDLFVWSVWRRRICPDCLDNVCACYIICSCRTNGVVGAIERDES